MPETIAYLATAVTTLAALQTTCNYDENQLSAELQSLQQIKIDDSTGPDATAATYSRLQFPTHIQVGTLVFVQISAGQNPAQIIQQQGAAGNLHKFNGNASVNAQKVNVMVFRRI